jgi:hypothetical protein
VERHGRLANDLCCTCISRFTVPAWLPVLRPSLAQGVMACHRRTYRMGHGAICESMSWGPFERLLDIILGSCSVLPVSSKWQLRISSALSHALGAPSRALLVRCVSGKERLLCTVSRGAQVLYPGLLLAPPAPALGLVSRPLVSGKRPFASRLRLSLRRWAYRSMACRRLRRAIPQSSPDSQFRTHFAVCRPAGFFHVS